MNKYIVNTYYSTDEVTIKIKGRDKVIRAFELRDKIREQLGERNAETLNLFEEFLSSLNIVNCVEPIYFDQKAADKVIEYLLDDKRKRYYEYSFKEEIIYNSIDVVSTSKDEFGNKILITVNKKCEEYVGLSIQHTLKHLVYITFKDLIRVNNNPYENTRKFVRKCYRVIESHLEVPTKLNGNKSPLSHYQITVMCALISSEHGYTFKRQEREINTEFTTNEWNAMAADMVSDYKK